MSIDKALFDAVFLATDRLRAAVGGDGGVIPPPAVPTVPDGALWVDPQDGDDGNDGRDASSPFRTLARAAGSLAPRSALILRDGVYTERLRLEDLGTSKDRPVWIKAENPGMAVFTGENQQLAKGKALWRHEGGQIYSAPFRVRPWAGHADGKFLFSYRSLSELRSMTAVGRRKPLYGMAHQGGRLYLRMPEGQDPTGHQVHVTESYAQSLVSVTRSPYVAFDGLAVTGAGNTAAIAFDRQSHHGWVQNVVCDLSRMLALLPSDSTLTWCQYGYSGLLPWAEEIMQANGSVSAVFDLVKKANSENGNAHYEGRIAVGHKEISRRCYFAHNLIGPCFDGHSIGLFSDSEIYRDVLLNTFDDGFEVESWRRSHDSSNININEVLSINAGGSNFSHQDTARQIRGPHRISKSIAYNPHPTINPAYVIKNLKLVHDPVIAYDRCFLHNRVSANGWGANVQFLFLDHAKGKTENLSIRNSIIWMEGDITDWARDWAPDCDFNILVADKDDRDIRGPNGRWFRSINDLMLHGPDTDGFDFRPREGSPLIGAGVDGVTVGPYDLGEPVKHRPMVTAFTGDYPEIWVDPA